MSDVDHTTPMPAEAPRAGTVVPFPGPRVPAPAQPPPRRQLKIRKLRVLALLAGLGALALISTVFGMLMAVASDLPALEEPAHRNSVLLDSRGNEIGVLTGNQRRIYLSEQQIAPVMKHAIIAVEDRRFYTNQGVDLKGIARALYQDVLHKRAVQGGSTIAQQFVKNALAAQDNRTVFVKLREAALAYHLTRKWSKDRILRNYLNTIYFGNGAYGIESAARAYFLSSHPGCDRDKARPCAAQLEPQEAALLAGVVASPGGYDPITHPIAAKRRRDLVLLRMLQQGFLTRQQYDVAVAEALPAREDLAPPQEETRYPYFTSWVKQQVVDKLGGGQAGARLAFEGGLRVRTTLDTRLQAAAEHAVQAWLPNPAGPRASLVAIKNTTGEVKAMIGGDDYAAHPFNLATQGQRQPGSAFKPFVLAEALRQGISPQSTWISAKRTFKLSTGERFTVSNYGDAYVGPTTLAEATVHSDNSVFAQVGFRVGPRRIARMARRVGIRTPVSANYANALGGLRQGVTPLDMAHAYETFAQDGRLTYGTLAAGDRRHPGPVGIEAIGRGSGRDFDPITLPDGHRANNHVRERRVISPEIAGTVQSILADVVKRGTATRAAIPDVAIAGKTGTTENYGDAWFVGWTKEYTVAVWVGYPSRFRPMKTEFQGDPVAGGTYPAGIWKTFMEGLLTIDPLPKPKLPAAPVVPAPAPAVPAGPGQTAPVAPAPSATAPPPGTGGGGASTPAPAQAAPSAPPAGTGGGGASTPAPAPSAAPPAPAGTGPATGAAASPAG